MRYDNLICDLDGTLVDSLPGIEFSAHEAMRHCLPDRQLPPLRPLIGPPIRQIFEIIWPDLKDEEINLLMNAFRKHYDKEGCLMSVVYPGVISTLSALLCLGVRLYVVTNKPLQSTSSVLRHVGLNDLFLDVSTPDKAGEGWKDKSEGVMQLIRRYKLSSESTMLVGDSWDDNKAAMQCGLFFVPVTYGYGYAKINRMSPASQENNAINAFESILKFYKIKK